MLRSWRVILGVLPFLKLGFGWRKEPSPILFDLEAEGSSEGTQGSLK